MSVCLPSHFPFRTVLQTLMAPDNSVPNVADTRYNPAASR